MIKSEKDQNIFTTRGLQSNNPLVISLASIKKPDVNTPGKLVKALICRNP